MSVPALLPVVGPVRGPLAGPLVDPAVAAWAVQGATRSGGFNWGGLLLLVAVAAVAWPLWRRARARLSRQRHERWARDEGWADRADYTPENDPDLRRDDPERP